MRAGKTSRNDIVLYQIFTYLAVIRLGQDLGFPQFRLLVLGQDQSKLYVFLQFLFDKEIMRTVLREVWYARCRGLVSGVGGSGGRQLFRACCTRLITLCTIAFPPTGPPCSTMCMWTSRCSVVWSVCEPKWTNCCIICRPLSLDPQRVQPMVRPPCGVFFHLTLKIACMQYRSVYCITVDISLFFYSHCH